MYFGLCLMLLFTATSTLAREVLGRSNRFIKERATGALTLFTRPILGIRVSVSVVVMKKKRRAGAIV